MSIPEHEEPLSTQNLVQNGGLHEFKTFGQHIFWPARFRVRDRTVGLNSVFNGVDAGDFAIAYLKVNAGITVMPNKNDDYFLIQAVINGNSRMINGRDELYLKSGQVTAINSSDRTKIDFFPHCEHLVYKIKRGILESRLKALINTSLHHPLKFYFDDVDNSEHQAAWLKTLYFLCSFYDNGVVNRKLNEAHVKLAAESLLHLFRHNYSRQLDDDSYTAAPWHVKAACNYVQENIKRHISVSDLSRASRVTCRTLQNAFNKYLDQSPSEYIRSCKLEAIHTSLKKPEKDTTVTEVMLEHSVYNSSTWARYYYEKYGEFPSFTLKYKV